MSDRVCVKHILVFEEEDSLCPFIQFMALPRHASTIDTLFRVSKGRYTLRLTITALLVVVDQLRLAIVVCGFPRHMAFVDPVAPGSTKANVYYLRHGCCLPAA